MGDPLPSGVLSGLPCFPNGKNVQSSSPSPWFLILSHLPAAPSLMDSCNPAYPCQLTPTLLLKIPAAVRFEPAKQFLAHHLSSTSETQVRFV